MVFAIFLYRRGSDFSEVRSDRDPPVVHPPLRRLAGVVAASRMLGAWPLLPSDFDGHDVYLNNTKHQKLHRKLSV